MHGKGILFIPKTRYLYYGFFKNNKRDGFGREFLMRMRVKATCFLMKKPKSLRKLQETSGSKYSERRDSGRESTKMT